MRLCRHVPLGACRAASNFVYGEKPCQSRGPDLPSAAAPRSTSRRAAAGAAALLWLVLVVLIYRMWRAGPIVAIFRDSLRESVMVMMIIAASKLFAFTLFSLQH